MNSCFKAQSRPNLEAILFNVLGFAYLAIFLTCSSRSSAIPLHSPSIWSGVIVGALGSFVTLASCWAVFGRAPWYVRVSFPPITLMLLLSFVFASWVFFDMSRHARAPGGYYYYRLTGVQIDNFAMTSIEYMLAYLAVVVSLCFVKLMGGWSIEIPPPQRCAETCAQTVRFWTLICTAMILFACHAALSTKLFGVSHYTGLPTWPEFSFLAAIGIIGMATFIWIVPLLRILLSPKLKHHRHLFWRPAYSCPVGFPFVFLPITSTRTQVDCEYFFVALSKVGSGTGRLR